MEQKRTRFVNHFTEIDCGHKEKRINCTGKRKRDANQCKQHTKCSSAGRYRSNVSIAWIAQYVESRGGKKDIFGHTHISYSQIKRTSECHMEWGRARERERKVKSQQKWKGKYQQSSNKNNSAAPSIAWMVSVAVVYAVRVVCSMCIGMFVYWLRRDRIVNVHMENWR